jgi:hypothetical protein
VHGYREERIGLRDLDDPEHQLICLQGVF